MSAPHFIVTYDFILSGKRVRGSYELDWQQLTSGERILKDVVAGQFEGLDRIYGGGKDVTVEIAGAVLQQLGREADQEINWHLRNWIEEHVGCRKVQAVIGCLEGV